MSRFATRVVPAPPLLACGERGSLRESLSYELAQAAPHPNPLPVRTGRGSAGSVPTLLALPEKPFVLPETQA